MRFRSGRISRYATEMSPNQQFPFKAYPARFPNTEPDHHLNPHYNPRGISIEQSRGFPKQSRLLLSSFAIMISRSNNRVSLAEDKRFYQLSLITTQGRLRCPQHSCENSQSHRATGLTLFRTLVSPSGFIPREHIKHNNRSPRKRGQHLHAIANCP